MADARIVNVGENTPEHVALDLFIKVWNAESKEGSVDVRTRKYILDTYAECLLAVREPQKRSY